MRYLYTLAFGNDILEHGRYQRLEFAYDAHGLLVRDFTHREKERDKDSGSYESTYERSIRMRQILDSFGVDYKIKKNFVYAVCPFHAGSGTKNFWISPAGGKAKCHSCGHETDWDGYAKAVGLPKLRRDGPGVDGHSYLAKRMRRDREDDDDSAGIEPIILPRTKPWKGPWRALSAKFLAHLGARLWWDRVSEHNRILFPVTNDGKVVGYTAGRAEPELEYPDTVKYPKYRTSRPLPTQKLLFMLDQIPPLPFLVLTEGPYDALRMLQAGMPACAGMGATNWSAERTDTLLMRPKLKRIFVAGDGDEGGTKMWKLVKGELKEYFKVSRITLPEGEDPGSVPKRWLADLKGELMAATGWDGTMVVEPWRIAP